MKTRFRQPPQPGANVATNLVDWRNLCKLAIDFADKSGDRRSAGLRRALETNQCEKILKSFGIICETDLRREFPTSV
jgi:hypothetical protein